MCGIAGYVGTRRLDPEAVRRALEAMRHRGPDHQGAVEIVLPGGRQAHLLGVRLSIIDLDPRSNQPFELDGRTMVYNGELYNYLELRAELERGGATFRTASDTEVLLAAVGRRGWEVLDRCEGMWAFAVHDGADDSITLCRDRFGEKPLFLLRDATGLYFGSEPKVIAALSGRPLRPDRDQLRRYLVNGYKSLFKGPFEFHEGLRELPAGTTLRIEPDGAERFDRYFRPVLCPNESMTFAEAVAGTRERLMRSVDLRLRADVPLAFCMSGGVDSVSIIAIAKRMLGYDVHGFTIVNSDARYEESDLVAAAVAELGLRHTAIPVSTGSFLPRLRALVRAHDGPVATISYYVHWLLMQAVAGAGYRVSVSGTAADELFSGYYDHHLLYLAEVDDEAPRAAWERHVRPLTRNPLLQNADRFRSDPGFRDHIYLDAARYASYLTRPFAEPFTEEALDPRPLRNRMLNELFHEAVPVILREDDLNAMSFSIENRSPYLDRALFDFAGSIPTRHLIRDGYAKAVLREAMCGIAPDVVLDSRRKVGFNAPIEDLLDLADPAVRAELLADSPVWELVRREPVAEMVERRSFDNADSKFLFSFLNTKMFLEQTTEAGTAD